MTPAHRPSARAVLCALICFVAPLAACTPPMPSAPAIPALPTPTLPQIPAPSAPAPTTSPTTTAVVAPTTTAAAGPALVCPAAVRGPAPAAVDAPAVELDEGEASAAASTAAAATDTGAVSVVSVDSSGKPSLEVVPPAAAASAAADAVEDPHRTLIGVEAVTRVSTAATSTAAVASTPATDPLRGAQWGHTATDVEGAWACGQGAGVTIAIVDTGVLSSHADLGGRVDSGVAFLDLAAVQVGGGGVDPHGHGTHVAGIAAATANNGIGVAGVAPQAQLLAVRVLDANGQGYDYDVARGITWAVDHGADVINLSVGSPDRSTTIATAISYALSNNVVVVAAAGNDGNGGPASYPGAEPGVLAVASFSSNGSASPFSTRGSYVSVSAPGDSILSTTRNGGYGYMSGTSMATPFAAGVAALSVAKHPTETPAQINARVVATAIDAGAPGFDTSFGWGKIDPLRAVTG